jgi:hypothetical protein
MLNRWAKHISIKIFVSLSAHAFYEANGDEKICNMQVTKFVLINVQGDVK